MIVQTAKNTSMKKATAILVALIAGAMAICVATGATVFVPQKAWADEPTAKAVLYTSDVDSHKAGDLVFYYDTVDHSKVGTVFSGSDLADHKWTGSSYKTNVLSAYMDDSFKNYTGITSLSSWFNECSNLTTVDMSGLQAPSATSVTSMFRKCSNLTTVDMSGADLSSVDSFSSLFNDRNNLTTVNLSNLKASGATSMSYMFTYVGMEGYVSCGKLTTVDMSGLQAPNVTSVTGMFISSTNLTTVDMSGADLSKVNSFRELFQDCSNLTTVDMSGLYAPKVTDTASMFNSCNQLKTINASVDWSAQVSESASKKMFQGCFSLVGGEGTRYDSKKVDATYARVDGGSGNPGYFTAPKPVIVSAQPVLGGSIDMRFNAHYYVATGTPQMAYKINEATKYTTLDTISLGNGQYYAFVPIAAKNMTDTITVVLYDSAKGSGEGSIAQPYSTKITSVAEYCNYEITELEGKQSKTTTDANTITLCKNMLYYGGYAQNYFKYNAEAGKLAYNYTSIDGKTTYNRTDDASNTIGPVGAGELDKYSSYYSKETTAGWPEGSISLYGCSLIMEGATTVRYYFKLTSGDSIDNYTFTAYDGDTEIGVKTPATSGSYYYIDIVGIAAHKLDGKYKVSVVKGGDAEKTMTVTYSPMYYAYKKYSSTTANLPNLVKSLYCYFDAAHTYKNPS